MNNHNFQALFNSLIAECADTLNIKGGEYSGHEDRVANFKRGAERTGAIPEQVLWIYLSKHLDSLETYVRDQAVGTARVRSEPIQGRIVDAINYLILLLALIEDLQGAAE